MRSTLTRACRVLLITGLMTGAVLAAPAVLLAAPIPSLPTAGASVEALPTFTWTAGSAAGIAEYRVVALVVGQPERVVATSPASSLTATATQALPGDVAITWFVRAVDGAGATLEETPIGQRFSIFVAPPPPTLTSTPAALSNDTAPTFSWTGDRTKSRWTIVDAAAGTPVQSGGVEAPSGQATAALSSGAFQLQVVQINAVGAQSTPATAAFTIDATPPAALSIFASRPSPSVGATPAFSWSGLEAGATAWWRVIGAGGTILQGPASTGGTSASPTALPAGSYSFEARQVDALGNPGPWATEPFAILAAPAAPPATTGAAALPSANWRKLTPRRGAKIRSTRPTLRWAAGPKGTRLYNVQIFLVGKGNALKKVRSAFPKRRSFTLPRRAALKKGSCYVWRVWPYRGSSFTSTPLGVSHFCIRK